MKHFCTKELSKLITRHKRIPLLLLCFLSCLCSFSNGTKINGVCYLLDSLSNTATVTWNNMAQPSASYVGDVVIPATVTYNGVEYSVTSIGESAFNGCSNMSSVSIPHSVKFIGMCAFYGCTGLTSIILPDSLKTIFNQAFGECTGLTTLTIPNSVTYIGIDAFIGCTGLTSISIPRSVDTIYFNINPFSGCSGLLSISVAEDNAHFDSREGCNAIIKTSSNTLISGCVSTTIPNSVTSIARSAFAGCTGLSSITIPNSVTSIGISAFSGCTGLSHITIPYSIATIDNNSFLGCSGLKSIVVDEDNSFFDSRENCNAIIKTSSNTLISGCSNTTIPNSVTSIADRAFYNCTELSSINIPNSVSSIGETAFWRCTGLSSIRIPNSVTSIGNSAFGYCSNIANITVDDGNTVYDSRNECNAIIETSSNTLISGCSNTIIPNSVTSIANNAFRGCTNIISIDIPKSVTSIGEYAFVNDSSLVSINVYWENPDDCECNNYCFPSPSSNLTVYIPAGSLSAYQASSFWRQFNLVERLSYEFDSLTHTATVVAPDSSKYSGDITIPAIVMYKGEGYSVTAIGDRAFYNCSGLNSITIPNSVTNIGDLAFYKCLGLTSITIPNSVATIGYAAFSNCSGLISLTIPNSITSIERYTFQSCTSLTSLTIPSSVTSIGELAFDYCYGLTSLTIPNSVTSIGRYAFSECTGLTSMTIPSSVTSIGEDAFFGCKGLTNITVDSNNPTYDSRESCNAIIETASNTLVTGCKNTIIPSSVKIIGYRAFYSCSGLTSITIPDSVTTIREEAFGNCIGLTSLTIPSSVTSIGKCAFYSCYGLTSVSIPSSVTSIGEKAFYCASLLGSVLTNINLYWDNPEICECGNYCFPNLSSNITYIPAGSLSAYQASSYWSQFNLVERTAVDDTNKLYAEDIILNEGTSEVVLPVVLNNEAEISDLQFDLYLPAGFSIAKDGDDNNLIAVSTERTTPQKHFINSQTRADGSIRIMCTSPTGSTFTSDSGAVVNIILAVADTIGTGTYEVELKNIRISNSDNTFKPADATATITVEAYIPVTHTVTYIVDGTTYKTEAYAEGAAITPLAEPTKEGYTFSGWSEIPAVMGTEDITVTGTFTENAVPVVDPDTDISQLDNTIYAVNATGKVGGEMKFPISMKNSIEATGFQFDLVLPEGITVAEEDDFPLMDLSLERTTARKTDYFNSEYQTDGSLRVLCNSTKGYAFTGNDGEVAIATLNIAADLEDGDYPVIIKNIIITDATGNERHTVDRVKSTITIESYLLGDANGDGNVDVSDFSAIAAKILGHPADNFVEKAADINGDTNIDVSDLSGLAYMILHPDAGSAGSKAFRTARIVGADPDYGTMADTDPSTYTNTIYASKATGKAGLQTTLSLNMLNDIEATGFQFDIYLPEGASFAIDEEGFPMAELSLDRTTTRRTDYFNSEIQTDGALRVLCNSTKGYAFSGNDGEVATVVLDLASTLADGDYPIVIKNIVVTDATGNQRFAVEMMKSTLTVGDVAPVYDENYNLQVIPFQIAAGSDDTGVDLLMQNKEDGEINMVDFDLVLPEGITLYQEEGEYIVDGGSRFASSTIRNRFACDVEENTDGSLHLSAYFTRSTASYVFSGTSGDIALLTLVADPSLADGIYEIELKNIVFNEDNSIQIAPYKASVFVGKPEVTDAVLYGNYTADAVDALNDCLSTDSKLASIDLSNAVAIEDDSEIIVSNDNCLIYVPEGTQLANVDNVVIGDVCTDLYIEDMKPFSVPKAFTATTAEYARTMTNEWGTIFLPYAISSDENMELYNITGIDNGNLVVEKIDKLAAGTPALVRKVNGTGINPTATDVPVSATINNATNGTVTMYGSYEEKKIDNASAYYIKSNKFWQCNNYFYCDPFRAYFVADNAGSNSFGIVISDDELTGISNTASVNADEAVAIYSIDGKRLGTLQQGVNIVKLSNGSTKKVVVK